VLLLLAAPLAHADRITEMSPLDRCVYVARLEMLAHQFFEQGKSRDDVVIHWHGDETQNEVAFVNKTVDDAYAWLLAWKQSSNEMLPAQSFGEMVFQACMEGKLL
jgi:hypothetical protein